MKSFNWRKLILPVLFFLLGIATGFAVREAMLRERSGKVFVERREGQLSRINPLLECDIANNVVGEQELRPFQKKIDAFLKTGMDRRWANSVSVYFRDLNEGLWFSIGETDKFIPASLRKVPLMIALLKQAEREKGARLLDREVKFELSQDYNKAQNIQPSQMLVPGRMYRVRDLIYRMIVYSDNNAFTLLAKIVDPGELDNVYSKIRILNPGDTQDDDFLSVQTYASFFRVLYNATYLSKEASDMALDILSKSEFRTGLVAGVPPEIMVSHKFGEHSDAGDGSVQLHDCGIVYYPQHPYILCVMSRGQNFEFLDDVIREVSRITYSEIDEQHRNH